MTKLRLINRKQLKEKGVTFSNPYLTELENKGEFPKRIRQGKRFVSWDEGEVDAFIEGRKAARGA